MKETGLFRTYFLGLVICSSVVTAFPSAFIAARGQPSNDIVELTHFLGGTTVPGNAVRGEDPTIEGGIIITGPASRVADLHQVTSSWTLFGCNPSDQGSQDVLAYCAEANVASCSSIFVGGASDTLVKLPDGCGKAPFAHVVSFVPMTKQLPAALRKLIGKEKVSVYELTFDYDFEAIPYNNTEAPTTMHMEFSNIAGYIKDPNFGKNRSYNEWLSFVHFTKDGSRTHDPVSKPFSVDLVNYKKDCKNLNMHLLINLSGKMESSGSYGIYVSGYLIPPKIDKHYAYLKASSSVESTLKLTGQVEYTAEKEIVIVPSIAPPGLNYDPFIKVGPLFEMKAKLRGSVTLNGTLTINTRLNAPPIDFSLGDRVSPPQQAEGKEYANFTISDGIELGAKVSAELLPDIGLGITILKKLVVAKISLTPSAELIASGDVSFQPSVGKVTPCVKLQGILGLDWSLTGKLGPWGNPKTTNIFKKEKNLFDKCYGSSAKRDIIPGQNYTSGIHEYVAENCPARNPFTKSPKP